MGKRFTELSAEHRAFIEQQKIFFVATAAADGNVNVSPKGMDAFRVLDANTALWLNVTGSGNETAAHLMENPRMTVMFCAFEGRPLILRLYGQAETVHPRDAAWETLYAHFLPIPGARQIFLLKIAMVQTSCGMAVPYFDYFGDRDDLVEWAEARRPEGIAAYWKEKNQLSIDGKQTGILAKVERAEADSAHDVETISASTSVPAG